MWSDPIHKEQLWKKWGAFHTKAGLTGSPNLVEVHMLIRGVTSMLTGSVCMVSGPSRLGWGPARCTAVSWRTEKLLFLTEWKHMGAITWPFVLLWPNVSDQARDLAPGISLGGRAMVFSRGFRGLTRISSAFSEMKVVISYFRSHWADVFCCTVRHNNKNFFLSSFFFSRRKGLCSL